MLVPTIDRILCLIRIPTTPLYILPHFHITLGGKNVCIDVINVQGPLYFNILLGHDYLCAMEVVVSTQF